MQLDSNMLQTLDEAYLRLVDIWYRWYHWEQPIVTWDLWI